MRFPELFPGKVSCFVRKQIDQGTAWSASCEGSLPGLQKAAFSLGLYMMGDSGVRMQESEGRGERESVNSSPFYKATVLLD